MSPVEAGGRVVLALTPCAKLRQVVASDHPGMANHDTHHGVVAIQDALLVIHPPSNPLTRSSLWRPAGPGASFVMVSVWLDGWCPFSPRRFTPTICGNSGGKGACRFYA